MIRLRNRQLGLDNITLADMNLTGAVDPSGAIQVNITENPHSGMYTFIEGSH